MIKHLCKNINKAIITATHSTKKSFNRLLTLGLFLVLASIPKLASATNHQVFSNIQRAQQQYVGLVQNVSLLVAFIGGVLSFLTPCAIGILPAYFAYTFQEKKELVKMTLLFFLGLLAVFIPIGLAASFIGNLLIIHRELFAMISGGVLLLLGVLTITGKGFSFIPLKMQSQRNALGIFIFGMLFGIGFTPCNGPILLAITTLAATQTMLYSALMFVLYGLGMAIPLLVLSFFFDKFEVIERLARGHLKVTIFGKRFRTHWTSLVAGSLFIGLGAIFIYFKNTTIFTIKAAQLGYPVSWAYSLQEQVIKRPLLAESLAVVGLALLAFLIYASYKGYKRRRLS